MNMYCKLVCVCVYICRYCKTYHLKRNLNKPKQYIWQMSDAEAKQVGALIAFRNGMLCGGYSTQQCDRMFFL